MQSTKSFILSQLDEKYKPITHFFNIDLQIRQYPKKHSKRLLVWEYLSTKFEQGRTYTEREVNEVLNRFHTFGDPATLRRFMFNYKFLNRTEDCRTYWVG